MTVGVFGLLAFTTAQRLPEMGVRVALGASRGQIRGLILRDALTMTVLGVAGGVAAGLALACWRPARKASRVDAGVVLRQE